MEAPAQSNEIAVGLNKLAMRDMELTEGDSLEDEFKAFEKKGQNCLDNCKCYIFELVYLHY